jgi:hypothetical protein
MALPWREQMADLPITRPSTVVGYANGEIHSSVLVQVDPNRARLIEPVARAYLAMKGQALEDGVTLNVTSAADGYRSYAVQETTFRIRYMDTGIDSNRPRPTSDSKAWNFTWWDKRDGYADAAVPGRSNHGWACAVDIANAGNPSRLAWLELYAARYGFLWENPTENWHLTYVMGDEIPEALRSDEEDDDVKYLHVICAGRPEAIVALDGAGATFVGLASPEDRNALVSAYAAASMTVTEDQYDELVRVARAGEVA